jgi:hypothetical protein
MKMNHDNPQTSFELEIEAALVPKKLAAQPI